MSIKFNENLAEKQKFPVLVAAADGIGDNVWVTYEQFVCNLVKDMGSEQLDRVHMALGVAGEAGELVDAIKKSAVYGKPLDLVNLVEELGDLEFYMAGLRQMTGISRYDTLQANVSKLGKRYVNGYNDAAAIARADKQEQPKFLLGDFVIDPSYPNVQLVVAANNSTSFAGKPYLCYEESDSNAKSYYAESSLAWAKIRFYPPGQAINLADDYKAATATATGLLTPLPQVPSVSEHAEQVKE